MSTATRNEPSRSKDQASHDEANATAEADIRALIEGVHRAHYNKDAATIAAQYSEDAALFDLAPPLSHRGMDLREKQAWLDSWDGPITFEGHDPTRLPETIQSS